MEYVTRREEKDAVGGGKLVGALNRSSGKPGIKISKM